MPRAFPTAAVDFPSTAFANLSTPAKLVRLLKTFPELLATLDALLIDLWETHHRRRRRRQATARLRADR